jgi:hypothetical protein
VASACDDGDGIAPRTEPYVIHVALQDGFIDEHVVVRLDGDEVFASESVRTRFQIGLAEEFELDVVSTAAELEFSMPARGVAKTVQIDGGEERWVGASVAGDGLEVVVSDRPFRYA